MGAGLRVLGRSILSMGWGRLVQLIMKVESEGLHTTCDETGRRF